MTREEHIEILKQYREKPTLINKISSVEEASWLDETLGAAIKALEQESCEDTISREELLKAIDTWDKFGCDADTKLVPYQDHYIPYIHYDDVVECIKGLPSVNPQPKIEQEPFMNKPCVAHQVCHEDKVKVLEKMRVEIEALPKTYPFVNHIDMYVKEDDVKKIIDKYRESEK